MAKVGYACVSTSDQSMDLQIESLKASGFPEYAGVFKDWDGKASLMTMREFPLPADIVVDRAGSRFANRWRSRHWILGVKYGIDLSSEAVSFEAVIRCDESRAWLNII